MSRDEKRTLGPGRMLPGRIPPHDEQAERGVLGSMLISREAVEESQALIDAEYFYVPAHRMLFAELCAMVDAKKQPDIITFSSWLKDRGCLDIIGGEQPGTAFVTSLFTFVPTAANIGYYLDIVREKFVLRQIIAAGTEMVRRAFEDQSDVSTLLDDVQSKMTGLAMQKRMDEPLRHVKEGVLETVNRFEEAFNNRGDSVVRGVATGLYDLDRMLSGLKAQTMTVIAARPSHGKTALGMNIASYAALELKLPVAVFSLEMSYQELSDRLVCSTGRINLQRIRDGFLKERDFPLITAAAGRLMDAPVYIDDTPALRLYDFKARARRAVMKHHVELIVIDYLQLMVSPSRRAQENRALEITEISGAIKATAKELNIPIIVCAQLNRDPEKRSMGTPKISDLRESGAIEQDADNILLLNRPIRSCESEKERERAAKYLKVDLEDLKELAILDVAKQRNGPVGEIRLLYHGQFTRFENLTDAMWSNNPEHRQHAAATGAEEES